ncbi:CehA/McbA family metallohydrolase [Fontimonas sp. SYSU GA230001]|uniref:CehA/McbA family metallohydrolase n=1 Tax=Fontimonas sp. SYSU GA230001 TaxID=3142450 RepID=UPI0032B41756
MTLPRPCMSVGFALLLALGLGACGGGSRSAAVATPAPTATPDPTPPASACVPGGPAVEYAGHAGPDQARTYRMLPFTVASGTGRVELAYGWSESGTLPGTPLTATTFDLGLWDAHGYRARDGFRGWSGSRQGRIDLDQPPVFVEAGAAERGYLPGPILPGTWFAELGIAAVGPDGADWTVRIACKAGGGLTPADDPVDAAHVARPEPGWYHGDFHMHAFHSNPHAPDWDDFIAQARAAQLDFLMVTEYVTGQHWRTLGAVQRANPDLLIWPGREIITYFGHATTHGETPSTFEYRHGFEDVSLGGIQRDAKADGALFQVNHPTSFPGPLFANFCRGCEFTLGDAIDWNQVDTIEILNGPVIATAGDIGLPLPAGQIENPFMTTAIQLWEDHLRQGHRITGVSGSDSKGVEPDAAERRRRGYGSSVTAVYAETLSRTALSAAIRAGHAYVRTRGVEGSPALEFSATTADGRRAIFGDTLEVGDGETVTLDIVVTGGQSQLLEVLRDGVLFMAVPIVSDPFVIRLPAFRVPLGEGPLGTMWRIQTRDATSRTTLGNPIFLKAP